jgi:phosphoglycolate phosphatase
MLAMRTAVIFDLDGVLVDSRAAITGCTNHALVALGQPERPEHVLYRYIGPPLSHSFGELLGLPPEAPDVAAMMAAYREHYASVSLTETIVEPGIEDALATLSGRHRLAVATSKPRTFAEPILAAMGLREHFEVIAAPAVDQLAEPKAETLARALDALGRPRAVMIGDRIFDIEAAHAHGLPCIAVAWGIGTAHELEPADRVVAEPAELPGAVSVLLAE